MTPEDIKKENWQVSEPDAEKYVTYQSTVSKLQFKIRFNANGDNTIEFALIDGDRYLGSGYQVTADFDDWIANFIYGGHFMVWLSNKKLQVM